MTIYDEFTRAYESHEGFVSPGSCEESDSTDIARYMDMRRGGHSNSKDATKGAWQHVAMAFQNAGKGFSADEALANARRIFRREELSFAG